MRKSLPLFWENSLLMGKTGCHSERGREGSRRLPRKPIPGLFDTKFHGKAPCQDGTRSAPSGRPGPVSLGSGGACPSASTLRGYGFQRKAFPWKSPALRAGAECRDSSAPDMLRGAIPLRSARFRHAGGTPRRLLYRTRFARSKALKAFAPVFIRSCRKT